MNATDFKEKYSFEYEGVEYLKLCYAIVLYWTGKLERQSDGLSRFFEVAWQKVGPHAKVFQTTNMKRPKKLTVDAQELVDSFLTGADSLTASHLRIDNRRHKDEAPDSGIELVSVDYRGVGYAIARLLTHAVTPEELLQISTAGAELIEFAHGHCGFALCYNDLGEMASLAEREFYALGMRHRGLDLPCANNTSFVIGDGLKCVNWLTFVGNDLLQKSGKAPAFSPPTSSSTVVHSLPHGKMFQAGPSPCIGDVNRKDFCDSYHVVGRLLADIRTHKHPAFIVGPEGVLASQERTEEWLSRFDE